MDNKEAIIQIADVSVGYRDNRRKERVVKKSINLNAHRGELIALIGGNGIGKSTLLRSITGFQPVIGGSILINGKAIHAYREKELAKLMSFVSTEIIRVANLSVFDLVSLGRFPHTSWFGRLSEEDHAVVIESIGMVGLRGYENRMVNQISDGERQRAMMARTLAQDTDIIVLDEPTAFLDVPNKYEIVSILHKLAREKNKTILFSTHDLNIALGEVDLIWLMMRDEVVQGAPEDLILNGLFPRLFSDSGIRFDMEQGDFRIDRKNNAVIHLQGHSRITTNWTRKALERAGMKVISANGSPAQMNVAVNENELGWSLTTADKTLEFTSLYSLCQYLRRITG